MLKRDDRLRDYVLPVRIVASEKTNNAKTLLNADLTQIGLREMDVATVHSGGDGDNSRLLPPKPVLLPATGPSIRPLTAGC